MRYRKKPSEVDAVQWTAYNEVETAMKTDWILFDIHENRIYICSDEVFRKSYVEIY